MADVDPVTLHTIRLAYYRVQTERLAALTHFLANTVKAPLDADGGSDPDVVSAYNLTVEAVLKHVRALVIAEAAMP